LNSEEAIIPIRNTACALLAASAQRLFPGVILLGGQSTSKGFYYDFIFSSGWEPRFLTLLQEQMYELVRRDHPIKLMEMVPKSAYGYFSSQSQPFQAGKAKASQESLVCLVQIDGFSDFANGEYVDNTSEVPAFFLQEAFPILDREEEDCIRIFGYAFFTKEESRKVDKKTLSIREKDHITLGKDLQYFFQMPGENPGEWAFLPKGELIREKLIELWKKKISSSGFEIVSVPSYTEAEMTKNHKIIFENFPKMSKLAQISFVQTDQAEFEGMFCSSAFFSDRSHVFCPFEKLLSYSISSLQFICEILNIFSWKYRFVLYTKSWVHNKALWKKDLRVLEEALSACNIDYQIDQDTILEKGPKLEVRLEDKMGKEHPCAFLYIDKQKTATQERILVQSLFGSLERFIALLIEQYEGALPFWLLPEQVRIIPTEKNGEEYALSVKEEVKRLGFFASVDKTPESLAKKLSQAEAEKIPYVVMIGAKEKEVGKISVRECRVRKEEMITLEQFTEKLRKQVTI